jgi:hypothetical protein
MTSDNMYHESFNKTVSLDLWTGKVIYYYFLNGRLFRWSVSQLHQAQTFPNQRNRQTKWSKLWTLILWTR